MLDSSLSMVWLPLAGGGQQECTEGHQQLLQRHLWTVAAGTGGRCSEKAGTKQQQQQQQEVGRAGV